MNKVEERTEIINIKYIAENGKSFESEKDCIEYEFFIKNKEKILSKIIFFREVEKNSFKEISYSEIKPFDYCCLLDDTYIQYHKHFDNYAEPCGIYDLRCVQKKGIYYLDYSNAYSGGYGFNGWEFLGTVDLIDKLYHLISIL